MDTLTFYPSDEGAETLKELFGYFAISPIGERKFFQILIKNEQKASRTLAPSMTSWA